MSCTVLESEEFGGRIFPALTIDNYPGLPGISGADYCEKLRAQAESFGAELKNQTVSSIEYVDNLWQVKTTNNSLYIAPAIIYAAGEKQRLLDIPGETEFIGRGVGFCAACDGALFRNKEVAVIGGGDKALDDALTLSRMCSAVHLIHRREEFRGFAGSVAKVKQTPNITLHLNRIAKSVNGARRVESITLCDTNGDNEEILNISGLFIAVGSVPLTALCAEIAELDEQGYIIATEDCKTSQPGLFAAGDTRQKPLRQLITAAADGAVAGKAAADYVALYKG